MTVCTKIVPLDSIKEEVYTIFSIDDLSDFDNDFYKLEEVKEVKERNQWTPEGCKVFSDYLEKYGNNGFLVQLFISYLEEDEEWDFLEDKKDFSPHIYRQTIIYKIGKKENIVITTSYATYLFKQLLIRRCHNAFNKESTFREGYFVSLISNETGCPFDDALIICQHVRRNREGKFLDYIVCKAEDVKKSLTSSFKRSEVKEFFGPKRGEMLLRIALACCYEYGKDYSKTKVDIYDNFITSLTFNIDYTLEKSYFGVLL